MKQNELDCRDTGPLTLGPAQVIRSVSIFQKTFLHGKVHRVKNEFHFHSFMPSSPKFKMVAQIHRYCSEQLVKTRKWNMHFHQENRTTFSKFHFSPGIFQWNARETCVLLTTQPKFAEFLDKLIQD